MSRIKRWFESNIDNFSDEELLSSGYTEDEIELLRDSFGTKKPNKNTRKTRKKTVILVKKGKR